MSDGDDKVRVCVRCRPLSQQEVSQGHRTIVQVDETAGTVAVSVPTEPPEPPKTFTFDNVFGLNSKQLDLYNQAARPIVHNILEGYNGTIFAYGQTGTGKTFTMEGDRTKPEMCGIIPNSFAHIFSHISHCGEEKTFLVRVSYMEIYNEDVRDLIAKDQNKNLQIKERPDIGVYVKDLSSVTVGSADEMDKIMTLGNKNRKVGETMMNERSSRSHAIFTVTVECSELGLDKQSHVRVGKLHLVDLAGSERQTKTGATGTRLQSVPRHPVTVECSELGLDKQSHVRVGKLHLVDLAGSERQTKTGATGTRLQEGIKINLSLSTLGNVISALTDAKATHVPYRNSKLTRLLQDSLGGNSKTVMIANIGPASYNYEESISTLRYAYRAKQIQNSAKINEDPKDALLRKFQQEIQELRKALEEGGEGEGSEEGDSESEEENTDGSPKKKTHRKKCMSEEKVREMEEKLAADRETLHSQKDMAESERRRLAEELKKREDELAVARSEQELLGRKLAAIERKVIVGGENLLEKAEAQARLLEESNSELAERRAKEAELRAALQAKTAERLDIEERYSSLQDEAAGKTRKLKKVHGLLVSAKSEMADLEREHQREMEDLLDHVRGLSRELRLQMLIINTAIPVHYQETIERYVQWNDDMGDWQVQCVAYTGNNMRSQAHATPAPAQPNFSPDLSSAYLSYETEAGRAVPDPNSRTPTKSSKVNKERAAAAKLKGLLR